MAKQSKRPSRRYRKAKLPEWFNVRFDIPTEWATIRIQPENALTVISNLYTIIDSPFWGHILALQNPLARQITEKDWDQVPATALVQMLQRIGDIRVCIDTFLPPPFNALPFEVRRSETFNAAKSRGTMPVCLGS